MLGSTIKISKNLHLVVYLLSSLYSAPVCRFRHMSYDLSPTILTEVAQQGKIVAP
jgi:hypothetical protein